MQTIHPLIDKSEIITLILADMRNRKLIMGLEATGLATDDFNTNLSYLIFSKMEITKEHKVTFYNWYEDTVYGLLDTDLNTFRERQVFLAERLYYALAEKRDRLKKQTAIKEDTKKSFLERICGKES